MPPRLSAAALSPLPKRRDLMHVDNHLMLQHVDHHLMHALHKEYIFDSRASPTGIPLPCSMLLRWSNASLKGLSHWDSATLQPAPPMEQRLAQGPLPLGFGHLAACSSYGATLGSRASPTTT
ncbi:hypothetical protein Adt_36468 [Abeliophyllum distichum]|uniref:Uncharacterized protein n=1 Tax=Abeliophyllum distichum TaxID=126358 RepID=A0ABD1QIY6_9LAMI